MALATEPPLRSHSHKFYGADSTLLTSLQGSLEAKKTINVTPELHPFLWPRRHNR